MGGTCCGDCIASRFDKEPAKAEPSSPDAVPVSELPAPSSASPPDPPSRPEVCIMEPSNPTSSAEVNPEVEISTYLQYDGTALPFHTRDLVPCSPEQDVYLMGCSPPGFPAVHQMPYVYPVYGSPSCPAPNEDPNLCISAHNMASNLYYQYGAEPPRYVSSLLEPFSAELPLPPLMIQGYPRGLGSKISSGSRPVRSGAIRCPCQGPCTWATCPRLRALSHLRSKDDDEETIVPDSPRVPANDMDLAFPDESPDAPPAAWQPDSRDIMLSDDSAFPRQNWASRHWHIGCQPTNWCVAENTMLHSCGHFPQTGYQCCFVREQPPVISRLTPYWCSDANTVLSSPPIYPFSVAGMDPSHQQPYP